MKKSITKSFGIILSLLFAFACVLVSGCGNKYKKMEFNVQYAFSADADQWYDIDDGISLVMGEAEGEIKKDSFGVGSLYIRINVSGVKAKHIGDIVVSKMANGGPSFSSVTVKEGEVFEVEIHETEKIQNSFKVYETKSKKSTTFDLEVSQALTEITADLNNNPAVMIGGSVDLKKYNNLNFLSNGQKGLVGEKQKSVSYSILSVGNYNSENTYTANGISSQLVQNLKMEDGVLTVLDDYHLTENSYIVRVQATSLYNGIAGEFDVYIVDEAESGFEFEAKYVSNDNTVGGKITLYPGSNGYSQTSIEINYSDLSDLYLSGGLRSGFGYAKYQPVVYIDGNRVEGGISSDSGLGYNVVHNDTNSIYTFTAFQQGKYDGYNVEIRMEIAGLNFAYSSKVPTYTDSFAIDKKVLPEEIRINNDENYENDTVYMQNDEYSTIDLVLNAFPFVDKYMVNNSITLSTDKKIKVKYSNVNKEVDVGEKLENIPTGKPITITLDKGVTGEAKITFSIQNAPSKFDEIDNNNITTFEKVFTLKGEMTAKSVSVFADAYCKIKRDENNPLIIDANNDTYFYVKVSAKDISSFAPNTITLDSHSGLVFGNDKTITTLSLAEGEGITRVEYNTEDNTATYKVKIKKGQANGEIDKVIISIAGFNDQYIFATKAVNTVSNADSIKVQAGNSLIKDMQPTDNISNTYFALESGGIGELKVVGDVSGSKNGLPEAINGVNVSTNELYNLTDTDGKFSTDAINLKDEGNSNPIRIECLTAGKTQAFIVSASYYKSSEDNLTIESKDINIQVATYNPIRNITLSITKDEKDEIVYVNKYFKSAAKTSITFGTNNSVTTELNFDDFDEDGIAVDTDLSRNNSTSNSVTGLKIYTNVSPSDIGSDSGVSFYLVRGNTKTDIKDIIGGKGEIKLDSINLLADYIYIELNGEITEKQIDVSLVATRFGVEDTVSQSIKINVEKHNSSQTDISVSGTEVKDEGNNSNYVYVKAGEEVQFTAQAINEKNNKYTDLAYNFQRIEKDGKGNIRYSQSGVAYLNDNVTTAEITVKDYIDGIEYKGLPLDGPVTLQASEGGLYVMDIYSLDSYNASTDKFEKTVRLFVNVSDGTEQNPYILRNATDFETIVSDKHYVLGRDFENTNQAENLINLGVVESKVFKDEVGDEVGFAGTIKGTVDYLNSSLLCNKTVRHILKYTANVVDGYATLFKNASETAKFENFDIITDYDISNTENVNASALVAVNEGTISNVGLTINSSTIASSGKLNFGGLVVKNSGTIDFKESTIVVKKLDISNIAADSNIGLVTATNSGNILADYTGIESLETLKFDVMANVNINTNTTNNINVGGIVGNMSAGNIKNILIGGKIETNSAGNLAGIAGNAGGTIDTVATFALYLTGTGLADVAGIVASSTGLEINNVRVESAQVEFTSLGTTSAGITANGKITGAGTSVAGIVANSNENDTIAYAAVESFIDTIGNATYYMLENTSESGKVYGLASGGNKVEKSFIDANIAGGTIYLTSDITTTNTYFVGNISKEITVSSNYTTKATYAVLYNETNKVVCEDPSPLDSDPWSIDGNYNSVRGKFIDANIDNEEKFVANKDKLYTKDGGIYTKLTVSATYDSTKTYYIFDLTKTEAYPYLLKDGKPFMVVRPTELNANLNASKLEEFGSKYIAESQGGITINKVDEKYTTDAVDEIVIINFLNDKENPLNNERLNTYKIKDLISSSVVPPEATGGIMFKIVEGTSFARIENNDTIVFTQVAGNKPIIVKCYSIINPNLVKYVVFYTEYGYTNVVMNGNNIETVVGADGVSYEITINTAPNSSAERIEMTAENLKEDFFTHIFDANNDDLDPTDFIEIETGINGSNPDIITLNAVSPTNSTTFTLTYAKYKVFWNGTDSRPDPIVDAKYYSDTRGTLIDYDDMEAGKVYYTDTSFVGNSADINVEFEVKLNLTKYFGENVFPKQSGENQYFSLKTLKLKVTVVKTATSLVVTNKPSKITTDSSLSFSAVMETGYFGVDEESSVNSEIENNTVVFDEVEKDSMYFTITPEVGYEDKVLKLLKQAGLVGADETECKNIASLFERFDINYVLETRNDKPVGYKYTIKTNFVNEYNYRYITEDIKFRFDIYSAFNADVYDYFIVTIKPTALDSAEIKNYTITELESEGGDNLFKFFEIESADSYIISPGHRGAIMVINLEPSYANLDWDKVTFTSTPLYVPELGREVYLTFEQIAFNKQTAKYETVPYNSYHYDSEGKLKDILVTNVNQDGIIEKGIKLFPYSERTNTGTKYTGKIYIYVGLTYFVGLKDTITAKLSATTIDNDVEKIVEQDISLLTQYLPGVSVSYSGDKINDGYLIQENTSGNAIDINLYGYEFVAGPAPTVSFSWIDGNSEYKKIKITSATFEDFKDMLYIENKRTYTRLGADAEFDNSKDYYIYVYNYVSYRKDNNVIHNVDGSTSTRIYLRVEKDIPGGFIVNIGLELTMDDGQTTVSQSKKMNFYPADYLINSINMKDIHTVVNTNNNIEIDFTTTSTTNDYSEDIYNKLIQDLVKGTDYSALFDTFSYINKGKTIKFSDVANDLNNDYPEFDVKFITYTDRDGIVKKYVTILAKNTINTTVTFTINYGFEDKDNNGTYELVFNKDTYTYTTTFNLRIDATTTEENAIPIDSAEKFIDFMTNGKGQDFILTNDIVLEDYTPIATEIASLDGNNKVIKIKSFAPSSEPTANYGLFSSFGTCTVADKIRQSILKNVVVDYSQLQDLVIPTTTTQIVFGGLVANNNGGLIYNCDIINLSNSEKTINIFFDGGSTREDKITFGGLVGKNNKIDTFTSTITNSRVGRIGFTQVFVDTEGNVSEININSSKIKFVLGRAEDNNGFVGITGAFAGENQGKIASSYVTNTSLYNYSTAAVESKTAGFVAENSGNISYSYVQADPNTMTNKNPYSKGAKIKAVTDGKVAGFAFTNSGEINNSYANTELESNSNFISGFVFENSGLLQECYSACTLNAIGGTNASEQPFIGSINGETTNSTGEIVNCYYYKDKENFNLDRVPKKIGANQATGLSLTNFRDSEMLYGFVFVLADSKTDSEQGVWSYYTPDGKYRLLPELTSTNMIATSYRYLTEKNGDEYIYTNATRYEQGSKNNPYIIRSVEEYNQVMTANGSKSSARGYMRIISDIDFTGKAVSTHSNFVLGDATNKAVTSIDGNGMTLKGIYLDAPSKNVESIGFFAEIKNAYIKNLNFEFDKALYSDKFSSISVKYSGGLAGKIENSVIINISLDGNETTLAGSNIVGGLAGIVTGSSLLYGIDSNLSVIATEHDTEQKYYIYYSEDEFYKLNTGFTGDYSEYITKLCYAGGLAGIIDIESRGNETYNIAYINIHGDQMMTTESSNIYGDYAGGIAGYAGHGTSSFKLKYYTGTTDRIVGGYVAGGLYGLSMGEITASQVTATEGESEDQSNTQYAYDTAFGSYIIGLKNGSTATMNKSGLGNLSLISSTYYAGGLVGIGINTEINSSYSKASFKSSQVVGGLIGVSISSKILYSYAVTYVNVDLDTINNSGTSDTDGIALQKVGGLIGVAYGNESEDREVLKDIQPAQAWFEIYSRINISDRVVGLDYNYNDVKYTFSTLLVDNKLFVSTDSTIKDTMKNIKFDYVSADYKFGDYTAIKSDAGDNKIANNTLDQVYVGLINYGDSYLGGITCLGEDATKEGVMDIGKVDLYTLYDVHYQEHDDIFDIIFSIWPAKYWTTTMPERYFPLLIDQTPVDRIEIKTAADVHLLVNNPSGDYIVKDNINMSNYKGDTTNSIVKKEFTGSIIGDPDLDYVPAFYNIEITNTTEGSNVGFFASSSKAEFTNLKFCYGDGTNDKIGINLGGDNNVIGGLVAQDQNSTITNINVWSGNYNPTSHKLNDGIITQLVNANGKTTAVFGGIVGKATNTSVREANFNANVELNMKENETAYFGGLVGQAIYVDNMDDFDEIEGFSKPTNMTIRSSKVEKTTFDITYSSNAYIGGAVGELESAVLSNVDVSSTFILKGSSGAVNFGGLAGVVSNSYNKLTIKSNDVKESTLKVSTDSELSDAHIAGLIGLYSNSATHTDDPDNPGAKVDTEVYLSNADMDIVFEGAKFKSLYVSQGIAKAEGNKVVLRSCLFAGSIKESTGCVIENIHAAGAVAYASSTNPDVEITLQEVMSTTDIILGSDITAMFISGGLVAKADKATIKYCVSTGRIVPTTSKYKKGGTEGNSDTIILIGGLAGWIKKGENSDIMNSYTLTSIITDGLGDDVMQGLALKADATGDNNNVVSINALFGVSPYIKEIEKDEYGNETIKQDISNVFYSTDFALAPEDSKLGTNLPAYGMVYGSDQHVYKGVTVEGAEKIWTMPDKDGSKLPFISSLTTTLSAYNVLLSDSDGGYSYDMGYTDKKGSPLRPIVIYEPDYNFDNVNLNKPAGDKGDKQYCYFLMSETISGGLHFKGSLNGILIGAEGEYTVDVAKMDKHEIGNNKVYGVVPHVNEGSAVSNLHITLTTGTEIDLTGKEYIGFVVGVNNGVIFNCSTQGIGITFKETSNIGMITHTNNGMVSYSYSTVEVISAENTTISGVTFTNDGKMHSDYFTGYIAKGSNEAQSAAGLIYGFGTDSYTYNCYMAGVIKCDIKENSFTAETFDENNTGANNFVDQWANLEFDKTGVVQSIDTVNLMAGSVNGPLAGTWTSIVDGEISETDGVKTFKINTTANSGFGRNYGYPIYDMNKHEYVLNNLPYYLNTGTGESSTTEGTDTDWYKIPHLGVFSIVDGILNAGKTDRNYLFIYDVDAKNNDWSKHAVGRTNNFTGTLSSNLNYTLSELKLENSVIVENLNASGLLDNIGDATIQYATIQYATIQYFKFGSMTGLTNSGAIGQKVLGEVKVNSIEFIENTTLSGTEVGTLFGTISANVEVSMLTYSDLIKNVPTISATEFAGLITAKMEAGTLKLGVTNVDNENDIADYFVKFIGCETAGGLVGNISGGIIKSGVDKARISIMSSTNNFALGGIVGSASGNSSFEDIVFIRPIDATSQEIIQLNANVFGGFISEVKGNVTFNNCSIALEKGTNEDEDYTRLTISANSDSEDNQGFGFMAGKISSGNLTIKGFKIVNEKDNLISATLHVQGQGDLVKNVGGIAGRYKTPTTQNDTDSVPVCLDKASYEYITSYPLILLGDQVENIGGAFGYVEGVLNAEEFKAVIDENKQINLLANGEKFAQIQAISGKNMGGLIGKVTDGTDLVPTNIEGLINGNPIVIPVFTSVGAQATQFENIGGVIGYVKNATLQGLINDSNITYDTDNSFPIIKGSEVEMLNIYNGAKDSSGNEYYSVRTLNVGGIAGYAENINIIDNLENSGEVQGYQNVGGIFGYATGVKDIDWTDVFKNEVKMTGEKPAENSDKVYFEKVAEVYNIIPYSDIKVKEGTNDIDGENYYQKDKSYFTNHNTMTSSGKVVGALNVGGAFGCIESSDIYGVEITKANVYGNVNVGGFAGYAPSGEYSFNTIIGDEKDKQVNIKGIYYAITKNHEFIREKNYVKNKSTYYIPTSIGGFIGKNISKDGSSDSYTEPGASMYYNTLEDVSITTTQEGWPSLQMGYDAEVDGSSVISTINNNVLKAESTNTLDKGTTDENSIDFWDQMKSGIGGFIGTTNSMTAGVSTNTLAKVDINASLGINVGAYYGYYCQINSASSLNVPKVTSSDEVSVSGSYIVGGLVGFCDLGTSAMLENFTYNNTGKITVQNGSITGMYVGGLIGRLNGSAKNIKLLSGITIDTTGDYYIGGLIGRLEGSLTSDSDAGAWTGTTVVDNIVTSGNDYEHFGGLVGMLKVKTDDTVFVQGKHNYWFTVNTIENSSYTDGETVYDAYRAKGNLYITALAYYVNNDKIEVAGSSRSISDWNSTEGPFNSSIGWAKEYTMFRALQRNIPDQPAMDPETNSISTDPNDTWDSLAVVYDANAIREVYTRDVAVNDNNSDTKNDLLGNGTPNNTGAIIEDYIDYTIYEDIADSPTLYTSFGVATMVLDTEGKPRTSTNTDNWDKRDRYGNKEDAYKNYTYEINTSRENIVTGFAWNTGRVNRIINDAVESEKIKNAETMDFYVVDPYYKYNGQNVFFLFDRMFGHTSLNGTRTYEAEEDNVIIEFVNSENYASRDGNLFNVSGTIPVYTVTDEPLGFWKSIGRWAEKNWEYIVFALAVIIAVIVIICSYGTATVPACQFLGIAATTVIQWGLIAKVVLVGLVLLAAGLSFTQSVGGALSKQTYLNKNWQTYGFISQTYTRELKYNFDGTYDYGTTDLTIEIDGKYYNYYSDIRPADYYQNRYFTLGNHDTDSAITTYNGNSDVHRDETTGYIDKVLDKSKPTEVWLSLTQVGDIYEYYVYKGGSYYITSFAGEVSYVPVQGSVSGKKKYSEYVSLNGAIYIAGNFDDTNNAYTVDSNDTALTFTCTCSDNPCTCANIIDNYKVNGITWKKVQEMYPGMGDPYYDAELKYLRTLDKTNSSWQALYGTSPEEGYAFITSDVRYMIGKSGSQYRMAKFVKTDKKPDGEAGIDYYVFNPYIKNYEYTLFWDGQGDKPADSGYTYYDGNSGTPNIVAYESMITGIKYYTRIETQVPSNVTVYYEYSNTSSESNETSIAGDKIYDHNEVVPESSDTTKWPEEIHKYIYPVQLNAPETAGNIIISEEWCLDEDQSDSSLGLKHKARFYWYEEKLTTEQRSKAGEDIDVKAIKERVTLEEGENKINIYKGINASENKTIKINDFKDYQSWYTQDMRIFKASEKYSPENGKVYYITAFDKNGDGDVDDDGELVSKIDVTNNNVTLFKSDGTEESVTLKTTTSFDQYYLVNPTEYIVSYSYPYDTTTGTLYKFNSEYNIIQGLKAELKVKIPNEEQYWYYNKYLTNKDTKFYSRYKYGHTYYNADGRNFISFDPFSTRDYEIKYKYVQGDDVKEDGKAYLVPAKNQSNPNTYGTTYLAESVNITIGGGNQIYLTNSKRDSNVVTVDKVGYIKLSEPNGS